MGTGSVWSSTRHHDPPLAFGARLDHPELVRKDSAKPITVTPIKSGISVRFLKTLKSGLHEPCYVSFVDGEQRSLSFAPREFTGALGDSITVLPIVVALAATTAASLPHVLIGFGVFQIVWGLRYGLPLSVEPMKVLAALAIAGTLSYAELYVAGLLAGIALLALGSAGWLSRAADWIPAPAIRGVQLAVALLLAWTGIELALAAPLVAVGGIAVAAVPVLFGYPRASAVAVLGVGAIVAVGSAGAPSPSLPGLPLVPEFGAVGTATVLDGTVAQLGMTLGNAAVATSLLLSDLYDRDVSPDRLSRSMGAMTLVAVPAGGLPMCHGSGGLAGKYAFGARTAGANVVLGVCYLLAALVATAALVVAFPTAVLGVLLVAVAAQLARAALRTDGIGTTLAVGVLGAATNVGLALVAGALGARYLRRRA